MKNIGYILVTLSIIWGIIPINILAQNQLTTKRISGYSFEIFVPTIDNFISLLNMSEIEWNRYMKQMRYDKNPEITDGTQYENLPVGLLLSRYYDISAAPHGWKILYMENFTANSTIIKQDFYNFAESVSRYSYKNKQDEISSVHIFNHNGKTYLVKTILIEELPLSIEFKDITPISKNQKNISAQNQLTTRRISEFNFDIFIPTIDNFMSLFNMSESEFDRYMEKLHYEKLIGSSDRIARSDDRRFTGQSLGREYNIDSQGWVISYMVNLEANSIIRQDFYDFVESVSKYSYTNKKRGISYRLVHDGRIYHMSIIINEKHLFVLLQDITSVSKN